MPNLIVSEAQINGTSDIYYDSGLGKIMVKIDEDTITRDSSGKIGVDVSALGVTVVSDDAGNIITAGTDTGAMLTADKIKAIVGEMVASSTDGIDYDALTNTLKAYLTSLAVTDTPTVDLTQTTDANSNIAIQADVKVSAVAGNTVEVKPDGLFVKDPTGNSVQDVDLKIDESLPAFFTIVDGVEGSIKLVDVQDLSSTHLFYAFA